VVIVLAIGPGSKPAGDDVFLRKTEVRSATFFAEEVKLSVPFCKILQHFKELYE
jgi:hypothetical protein